MLLRVSLAYVLWVAACVLGMGIASVAPIWAQPELAAVSVSDQGIDFATPLGDAAAPVYTLQVLSTGKRIAHNGERVYVDADGLPVAYQPSRWDRLRLAVAEARGDLGYRFGAVVHWPVPLSPQDTDDPTARRIGHRVADAVTATAQHVSGLYARILFPD